VYCERTKAPAVKKGDAASATAAAAVILKEHKSSETVSIYFFKFFVKKITY